MALVDNKDPKEVPFSEIIDYSNSDKRSSPNDYVLIQIDIPARFRYEITKSLYLMNMTAEALYPDIIGLAKSENYQRYF